MLKHYLIFYIVFFIFCLAAGLLEWPLWIMILVGLITLFIIIGDTIYTLYGTTNMKKVEKFLLNNKRNPLYYLVYVQANGTKEELIQTIEELLKKQKNPFIQQYYSTIREYSLENFEKAMELAEKIQKDAYKNYAKALIHLKLNQLEQAENLLPSLSVLFMKEEILALIAYKNNDSEKFAIHSKNCIEACKGVQRYNMIKTFERIKKEGF